MLDVLLLEMWWIDFQTGYINSLLKEYWGAIHDRSHSESQREVTTGKVNTKQTTDNYLILKSR